MGGVLELNNLARCACLCFQGDASAGRQQPGPGEHGAGAGGGSAAALEEAGPGAAQDRVRPAQDAELSFAGAAPQRASFRLLLYRHQPHCH